MEIEKIDGKKVVTQQAWSSGFKDYTVCWTEDGGKYFVRPGREPHEAKNERAFSPSLGRVFSAFVNTLAPINPNSSITKNAVSVALEVASVPFPVVFVANLMIGD